MSIEFDIKLSLELDGITVDMEESTAAGLHGIAARWRERKQALEAHIFDGQPKPRSTQDRIDYYEYIQSPAWRQKAEAAKQRAAQRCQVCNRHKREVRLNAHHRTYERLGSELPEDLTVLCEDCHRLYEENKR